MVVARSVISSPSSSIESSTLVASKLRTSDFTQKPSSQMGSLFPPDVSLRDFYVSSSASSDTKSQPKSALNSSSSDSNRSAVSSRLAANENVLGKGAYSRVFRVFYV